VKFKYIDRFGAMDFDVFISYPSEDRIVAFAACAKLEAEGVRCWIAPRDVPPGVEWAGALVDAIDHCRAMALIFSSRANESEQVRREAQRAFNRGVPVVPFRIENVVPEKSLAFFMESVHWLEALTPPLEQHLQKLATSVNALALIALFVEIVYQAGSRSGRHGSSPWAQQRLRFSLVRSRR
jgi:hypothetical protein